VNSILILIQDGEGVWQGPLAQLAADFDLTEDEVDEIERGLANFGAASLVEGDRRRVEILS
jgi:hypothetical protein